MGSSAREPIVVVGASLSGLRCCEELRRQGFSGRVVVIGNEDRSFYDRPPLSKQFLTGEYGDDRIALCTSEHIKDLDLDFYEGTRAISVDLETRRIGLESGDDVAFSGLVIATGATAKNLPARSRREGVVTLRTVSDAILLKERISAGGPLVVLGAGFLGMEVAWSLRLLGADVTVIELASAPLARVLGPVVGHVLSKRARDHGVRIVTEAGIDDTIGRESLEAVRLSDGSLLPAATLVVAIGVTPETSWLESSCLQLNDGVVCEDSLVAGPRVVAVGDVARFPFGQDRDLVRIEHWTNAAEQGTHGAKSLLALPGSPPRFETVPYFWSDQFDAKIQAIGLPSGTQSVEILDGSFDEYRFVAAYGHRGLLTGAVSFNSPRKLMALRPLVEKRANLDEARALFAHR